MAFEETGEIGKIFMVNFEREILKTLQYFFLFNYPPTFEEIYTFLPKKVSKIALKRALLDLERKKKIISQKAGWTSFSDRAKIYTRYTLGEYSIKIQNSKLKIQNENSKFKNNNLTIDQWNSFKDRCSISKDKLKNWRFRVYIRLLSFFPQIKLVGLSGSMAMMNAREEDDIDLFIITAKNRLFTGRFIALVLAQLLGIRRKRVQINQKIQLTSANIRDQKNSDKSDVSDLSGLPMKADESRIFPDFSDKVCLNLFFDERALAVPNFKKTEYVAHEVLQMKPIINKDNVYQRFLRGNSWVIKIFPNSKFKIQNSKLQFKIQNFKFLTSIFNFSFLIFNLIAKTMEKILKGLQLYFINRHKTSEIILDTQLWFHPDDFGKKIPR